MTERKGSIFRCRVNKYIQGSKIHANLSFTLMKKISEKPDKNSNTMTDFEALKYEHDMADLFDGNYIEFPDKPVHGGLYKLELRSEFACNEVENFYKLVKIDD
jgi:hypothetical protein